MITRFSSERGSLEYYGGGRNQVNFVATQSKSSNPPPPPVTNESSLNISFVIDYVTTAEMIMICCNFGVYFSVLSIFSILLEVVRGIHQIVSLKTC